MIISSIIAKREVENSNLKYFEHFIVSEISKLIWFCSLATKNSQLKLEIPSNSPNYIIILPSLSQSSIRGIFHLIKKNSLRCLPRNHPSAIFFCSLVIHKLANYTKKSAGFYLIWKYSEKAHLR